MRRFFVLLLVFVMSVVWMRGVMRKLSVGRQEEVRRVTGVGFPCPGKGGHFFGFSVGATWNTNSQINFGKTPKIFFSLTTHLSNVLCW